MSEENKRGRPSEYTPEIARRICAEIAEGEKGLREILGAEDMPSKSTLFRWLADESNAELRTMYAQAREMQQEAFLEEILHTARDSNSDSVNSGDKIVFNTVKVQRDRLICDNLKWVMSRLAPKKYGDKVTQELTGGEKPIETITRIELVPVEPVRADAD